MSENQRKARLKGTDRKEYFERVLKDNMEDISSLLFWKAVFAEYLGTFLLNLFTIGVSLRSSEDPPAPFLQIVLTPTLFVPAIIASLAHVSCGCVNPAVSLGFLLRKDITLLRFVFYVLVQTISSISAVLVLKVTFPTEMHGNLGLILPSAGTTAAQALFCETVITFFLIFGIMCLLDDDRTDSIGPPPIYVGFIVGANILFAGHVSGGCMNPARNIGPAVVTGNMDFQWVYWVGPLLGAILGATCYNQFLCPTLSPPSILCSKSRNQQNANGRPIGYEAESIKMLTEDGTAEV